MRRRRSHSSKSWGKLRELFFPLSVLLGAVTALMGASWSGALRPDSLPPSESSLAFAAPVDLALAAEASASALPSKSFKGRLPITELSEDEAILHALNRLGYGPRPGDIERVRRIGLERWIEQQLHP